MAGESTIDGPLAEWKRTGDPRWVWRTIHHCNHHREPYPEWVREYLDRCAIEIEALKGDHGRQLQGIFGFSGKRGRKRNNDLDLADERFAMAFARQVLNGVAPTQARGEASETAYGGVKDDDDLKDRLRKFFGLKALPRRGQEPYWKVIVSWWLVTHPSYKERYPDMPPPVDFG